MPTNNTVRMLLAIIAVLAGTVFGLAAVILSHAAGATPPVAITAGIGCFFGATTVAFTAITYTTGT
jgi:hypothetical protein